MQPDPLIDEQALQLVEQALELDSASQLDFIHQSTAHNPKLRSRTIQLMQNALDDDSTHLMTGAGAKTLLNMEQPTQIGNYRVVEEIGRGGMGVVYLAKRTGEDFEHTVAIKLVALSQPTDKLTQRLRDERRLLASLQHQNIAQFIDGGQTPNGQPYFVMEYVKGLSLQRFLDQKKPPLNDRLSVFQQICKGVAYAHRNLVIHRDLSPGNIMVSKDNTVKIIDFGISHTMGLINNDSHVNLTHTKGFTAPERLSGMVASTVSDVYSLGRLLEYMLNFSSMPRQADVLAIIRKATAQNPKERYQSVESLERDVLMYCHARPVDAVEGNWLYHAKRYALLYKVPVSALSIAILSTISAVIIFATLYVRTLEAEQQASQRFDQVRELANFMLFDLYDELTTITGTLSTRESVADKAKTYLDSLSKTQDAALSLQLETLEGYKRLAYIVGIPTGQNLGKRDEAKEALNKALEGFSKLNLEYPNTPEVLRGTLETNYAQAIFEFYGEDNSFKAIDYATAAESAFDQLNQLNKLTINDYISVIDVISIHGNSYIWEQQGEQGLAKFKLALKLADNALMKFPDNLEVKIMSARLMGEYGDAQSRHMDNINGEYDDALNSMNKGIEQLIKLQQNYPVNISIQNILGALLYKRGALLYGLYKSELAIPDLTKATSIYRAKYNLDNDDFGSLRSIGVVVIQHARALIDLEDYANAIELANEALDIRKRLSALQPDNIGYQREYAEAQISLAEILFAAGKKETSCAPLGIGLNTMKDLEKKGALQAYAIANVLPSNEPFFVYCTEKHGAL